MSNSALACTGWNRAPVKFLARLVLALLSVQSVCLAGLSVRFASEAAQASNDKPMQRFVRSFELDFAPLSGLLVQIAGVPPPWVLALERTNGKRDKADTSERPP